jgi:hypothetical protein
VKKRSETLVVVEWRDIIGTSGWEKPSDVNPPTFWTVGYIIKEDDNTVKLAHTVDEKGNWSGITAFPSGCIKSIKKLED